MAAITNNPGQTHWKDVALQKAERLTDVWDIIKAWSGRSAEIVLTFCMFAQLIGVLPGVHYWPWADNVILAVQVIMLDMGAFALHTLADQARSNGQEEAANKADKLGTFLIRLMITTIALIIIGQVSVIVKDYAVLIQQVVSYLEIVLILVRVVSTVRFIHVIHSLRGSTSQMVQPTQVVTIENRLQEMATQMTENQNSLVQQLRKEIEAQRQAISQLIEAATFKTDDITHDSFVDMEMEDDLNIEIPEEGTKTEEIPISKITVKLTPDITKVSTKKEPTAKQKAAKMLQRNSSLTASDIAKKLNITRQYASIILAEMKGN